MTGRSPSPPEFSHVNAREWQVAFGRHSTRKKKNKKQEEASAKLQYDKMLRDHKKNSTPERSCTCQSKLSACANKFPMPQPRLYHSGTEFLKSSRRLPSSSATAAPSKLLGPGSCRHGSSALWRGVDALLPLLVLLHFTAAAATADDESPSFSSWCSPSAADWCRTRFSPAPRPIDRPVPPLSRFLPVPVSKPWGALWPVGTISGDKYLKTVRA